MELAKSCYYAVRGLVYLADRERIDEISHAEEDDRRQHGNETREKGGERDRHL